jgi:lipoprotein-anchoring transpeptidase ErfK/SrfK
MRIGLAACLLLEKASSGEATMRQPNPSAANTKVNKSAKVVAGLSLVAVLFAAANAGAKDVAKNTAPPSEAKIADQRNELVISIPDRKLALFENGRVVKVYAVAVGTPHTPSPTGRFRIVNHIVRPTYYHKGVVIGPGRGNPLGNRWMGFDLKGYGIHGTNEPHSIGRAASHGCIRMGKRDVEDLFSRVRVGDAVEIQSAPLAELAPFNESPPQANAVSKAAAQAVPALTAANAGGL